MACSLATPSQGVLAGQGAEIAPASARFALALHGRFDAIPVRTRVQRNHAAVIDKLGFCPTVQVQTAFPHAQITDQ
jgi:hypothetical protein